MGFPCDIVLIGVCSITRVGFVLIDLIWTLSLLTNAWHMNDCKRRWCIDLILLLFSVDCI